MSARLHAALHTSLKKKASQLPARRERAVLCWRAGMGRRAGDAGMDRMMEYCWRMAAEYTRRAEETTDPEVREFFYRMRDNWERAAHRQEMLGDAGPGFAGARDADARPVTIP